MSIWDQFKAFVAGADEATLTTVFSDAPAAPTAREAALAAQLAEQQATFAAAQAAQETAAATQRTADAVAWADRLVLDHVILPALRPVALAAFAQALADDSAHATVVTFSDATGTAQTGDRAATLRAVFAGLGAQAALLGPEQIPAQSVRLPAVPPADADVARVRRADLMHLTPLGQLAARNGKES